MENIEKVQDMLHSNEKEMQDLGMSILVGSIKVWNDYKHYSGLSFHGKPLIPPTLRPLVKTEARKIKGRTIKELKARKRNARANSGDNQETPKKS